MTRRPRKSGPSGPSLSKPVAVNSANAVVVAVEVIVVVDSGPGTRTLISLILSDVLSSVLAVQVSNSAMLDRSDLLRYRGDGKGVLHCVHGLLSKVCAYEVA